MDSSPRYIFNPLVPYRINMVRPGAKFVIVLRDPTDRYCTGIYMANVQAFVSEKGHDCAGERFRSHSPVLPSVSEEIHS